MVKKCIIFFITGFILVIAGISGIIGLSAAGLIDEMPELTVDDLTAGSSQRQDDIYFDMGAYKPEDIDSLDISLSMGRFELVKGDEFTMYGENIDPSKVLVSVNNGCLTVSYKTSPAIISLGVSDGAVLYLTVPGKLYDKVKAEISAGEFNAWDIVTSELVLEVSAGTAELDNVNASDSADIKMSGGKCGFYECLLTNPKIKASAGSMVYEGLMLNGDTDINVSAGSVYMGIYGSRSDYEITTHESGGSVVIEGGGYADNAEYTEATELVVTTVIPDGAVRTDKEYVRTEHEEHKEHAKGSININVSAGSCELHFYDNCE